MKHSIKTFFIISVCLLFVLTPILARAQFVEAIAGVNILSKIMQAVGGNDDAFNVGNAFFGFFTVMISSIAQAILSISYNLLDWVISPDFIGPVIQDNPVVQSGWEIVRNLANVALVFGLVAIAISIIVGYQETKAKQALVNFIGVALLINFTPVLCGVVIDFANKLMTLYLNSGGISQKIIQDLTKGLLSASFNSESLVEPIAFILFSLFASAICFLYAFIFVARHVVLWVLVIVSPIAFASKVFPGGGYVKKVFPSITHWDEWWSNFLQWTVIGIPASFSLYLSNLIMGHMSLISTPPGALGNVGDLVKLIIPFGFLVVGFFVTLSSGGEVAQKVTGWAKKTGGAIATGAAGAGLGFASGAIAGSESPARLGALRGAFKGAAQGMLTGGAREKEEIKRWTQRNVGERLGITEEGTAQKEEQKLMKGAVDRFKSQPQEIRRATSRMMPTTHKNWMDKFGAIIASINEGEEVRQDEIDFIINNRDRAQTLGVDLQKVARYAPEHTPRLTNQTTEQVLRRISVKNFPEAVRAESFNDEHVIAFSNERQLRKTLEDGSREQSENIRRWSDQTEAIAGYRRLVDERNTAIAGGNVRLADELQRGIDQFLDNHDFLTTWRP